MDPVTILALLDGVIAMGQKLVPAVEKMFSGTAISPEDQAALQKRIDAIRDGSAFTSPEWQVER